MKQPLYLVREFKSNFKRIGNLTGDALHVVIHFRIHFRFISAMWGSERELDY